MSRRRLEVQVCLLSGVIRQYGSTTTSDLLSVCYYVAVPQDAEPPFLVHRMDLFVRFLITDIGPKQIGIRVRRLNAAGAVTDRVNDYTFRVPFARTDRIREHSFRLANLQLPGLGLYAVRVGRWVKRKHWERERWRTLGSDYFEVVRQP